MDPKKVLYIGTPIPDVPIDSWNMEYAALRRDFRTYSCDAINLFYFHDNPVTDYDLVLVAPHVPWQSDPIMPLEIQAFLKLTSGLSYVSKANPSFFRYGVPVERPLKELHFDFPQDNAHWFVPLFLRTLSYKRDQLSMTKQVRPYEGNIVFVSHDAPWYDEEMADDTRFVLLEPHESPPHLLSMYYYNPHKSNHSLDEVVNAALQNKM